MNDKVKMPFGQSKSVTPDAGFDPKLKEAISEIVAICQKYDVAGFISLASKTHCEFRNQLPTWSPVFFEGENLRFRAKRVDYATKEEHAKAVERGAWIVKNMKDMSALSFNNFDRIDKMMSQVIDVEHKSFHGFKPHREQ